MPTYAYRCTACDHRFEAVQRMVDDPLTECPTCGGFVKRQIQNVGVVFKGSGWYVTDSRKSGTSTSNGKDAEAGGGEKTSEKAKGAKSEALAAAAD